MERAMAWDSRGREGEGREREERRAVGKEETRNEKVGARSKSMEKRGNDQISDSEMKTGCGCIDEKGATKKRV